MPFSEETRRRLEAAGFSAVIVLVLVFIYGTIWIGKKFDYQKKQPAVLKQELHKHER